MIPKRIYLSGGGICAIAHVGALEELNNKIPIKIIKEWMGVSAGALVAMCICIGYSLTELKSLCMKFDFTNIKEYDSVPGWILHFGIDTGERLHKLIEACLRVKGLSSDLTFKECTNLFSKKLKIVVTDLNEGVAKIFSSNDTPDYKIADAVRASMSYPYYFQPFIDPITGHYFADGGIISNYPLFILPKEEIDKTLSILLRTLVEVEEELEIDKLLYRPISIVLTQRTNIESKFYTSKCIEVDLGNINILDFDLNDETKNMLYNKGKGAVINYYEMMYKTNNSNNRRRHSIH